MAEPATRHYNLRSGRQQELHVEIQMSDDATFLLDLLLHKELPYPGKLILMHH